MSVELGLQVKIVFKNFFPIKRPAEWKMWVVKKRFNVSVNMQECFSGFVVVITKIVEQTFSAMAVWVITLLKQFMINFKILILM